MALSGINAIMKVWQRVATGKSFLRWFILLISAVVVLGLAALYITKNSAPGMHDISKHHHKHKKHHDD